MLAALLVYGFTAIGIVMGFERPGLTAAAGLGWTLALVLPGVLGWFVAGGTPAARLLMAASLSALVMLQIQASGGLRETHFGVFVTLALLMAYLDWRPILLSATLFAMHHVGFDRLQAAGWGLYCLSEPHFATILAHAAYVVVQTLFELFFVVRLAASMRSSTEVAWLARHMQHPTQIVLDTGGIEVQASLARELKAMLARTAEAVSTVREGTGSIQQASSEFASGNLDLKQRTELAAGHLQQAADNMQQLTAHVRQNAEAAQEANRLAGSAAQVAQRGGHVVHDVVTTMNAISDSSHRIADIIGVIDGIAFQTNILALNASVEAARAGEQGRGFAVVAGEVRSLAQRSAQAASEIRTLIQDSVDKVRGGGALVAQAGATMQEIVASVQRVNDLVSEISHGAAEQSASLAQVHGTVNELDQMTRQNAALVEQSAAAAMRMREQVDRVAHAVQVFRTGSAEPVTALTPSVPPAASTRQPTPPWPVQSGMRISLTG